MIFLILGIAIFSLIAIAQAPQLVCTFNNTANCDYVYRRLLGLGEDEISKLKVDGVIIHIAYQQHHEQ